MPHELTELWQQALATFPGLIDMGRAGCPDAEIRARFASIRRGLERDWEEQWAHWHIYPSERAWLWRTLKRLAPQLREGRRIDYVANVTLRATERVAEAAE